MTVDTSDDAVPDHDSTELDNLARERTSMARERTFLANERTFLSYVRTAIMLFATGVTLIKLFPGSYLYIVFGIVLVGFSFFALVLGVFRYKRMKSEISEKQ